MVRRIITRARGFEGSRGWTRGSSEVGKGGQKIFAFLLGDSIPDGVDNLCYPHLWFGVRKGVGAQGDIVFSHKHPIVFIQGATEVVLRIVASPRFVAQRVGSLD